MTDMVNHPPHYENNGPSCEGCGRPIQCIEVREGMTANISDAVKYLWRQGDKDGADPIEDLKKARWYLDREIKRRGADTPDAAATPITVSVSLDGEPFERMVAAANAVMLNKLADSLSRQR